MNQFQRVGTFIARLAGGVALPLGGLGMAYAAAAKAGLLSPAAAERASMIGSTPWLGCGLLLLLSSRRLGRWLGRGLD